MSPSTRRTDRLAADAWRDLFDFIVATVGHRNAVLARLGLTPNDSRALTTLDPETGRPMRSLARAWECDASTATWIVDRLEARGLVERRSDPADRRLKLVVLTPDGIRTRDAMVAQMYVPPPELLSLPESDLLLLRDAVARLPRRHAPPDGPQAPAGPRSALHEE